MNNSQSAGRRFVIISLLCLVSALCNVILNYFVCYIWYIPLYLDTVFTVALCFSTGLLPSLLNAALILPVCHFLLHTYVLPVEPQSGLVRYLFTLCVVCEALTVCFYHVKMKRQETAFFEKPSLNSFLGVAAKLLVLAVIDCVIVSVTGGIIDFIITKHSAPRPIFPEDTFKLGLLRNNVPVLATAILSRIPINIIDRFIAVFGGYGISTLYRKALQKKDITRRHDGTAGGV